MQRSVDGLREIMVAAAAAAAVEVLLVLASLNTASELRGRHFWLEVSQMPGAQVSERLFRHVGLIQAIASTFFIQWCIFTMLILGCMYCYRLFRLKNR